MSDASVPAKAAPQGLAPLKTDEPRKLDDVLLAMDVVDTLRHRERVVDMELDAEARETQLIERLKDIYAAQGIEVPERILKDGVKALEEQRFTYKPPENTFGVKLARAYVNRRKWLPGAMTSTTSASIAGGADGALPGNRARRSGGNCRPRLRSCPLKARRWRWTSMSMRASRRLRGRLSGLLRSETAARPIRRWMR